jgi:DNA ligase-1
VKAFASLIDALIYTRSRNSKLTLISDYLRRTPDPDRGWALAALTGVMNLPYITSSRIRGMAEERVDPVLLRISREYIGDTAETVALIWPTREGQIGSEDISLTTIVETLSAASRMTALTTLADLLDRVGEASRYALLKLVNGGIRVGVSARLAKQAFANAFGLTVDDVDEVWHATEPPFAELFDWAEGRGARPDLAAKAFFRPFMLAHPFEEETLSLDSYVAEWKWDGIRVQIVRTAHEVRLFSRGGDDISAAFPEIIEAFDFVGAVDGELMIRGSDQGGEAASFNALQQRLGRKSVTAKMRAESPAFVRLYDILADSVEDVRMLPWSARRVRLEGVVAKLPASHFDLSHLIDVADFAALTALRANARDSAIEGVMLKRRDSPYASGRKSGEWYKWKREPLVADCVMMYAQRGNGRRASFYSDYTFGCWGDDGTLLPVGKAYSGFSDEELKRLDKFVRQNVIQKFGPVCEVEKSLVLEVAFDSIHASKRHKSGLAMRFPRIKRIRYDKPAAEADRIETLQRMVS